MRFKKCPYLSHLRTTSYVSSPPPVVTHTNQLMLAIFYLRFGFQIRTFGFSVLSWPLYPYSWPREWLPGLRCLKTNLGEPVGSSCDDRPRKSSVQGKISEFSVFRVYFRGHYTN